MKAHGQVSRRIIYILGLINRQSLYEIKPRNTKMTRSFEHAIQILQHTGHV